MSNSNDIFDIKLGLTPKYAKDMPPHLIKWLAEKEVELNREINNHLKAKMVDMFMSIANGKDDKRGEKTE